jgi:hypothetical protein
MVESEGERRPAHVYLVGQANLNTVSSDLSSVPLIFNLNTNIRKSS